MPALAQPDNPNRVGKASVAPQVQDRAQAELRAQQGGDRGGDRGHRAAPAAAPAAAPQAQAAPQNRGNGQDRGNGRDRGNRGTAQAAPAAAPAAAPGVPQNRGNWQGRSNGNGANNFGNRNDNRPGNRPGNSFGNNRGPGNPGYGGPRHDYSNFRDFHRNFNASRRFRGPSYRRPAGWYDHRWTFGEFLPAAFWARDYWLSDYTSYDLPPPPYGATWVRVGNDALLVDEDSGEVITVEYDVFY